MQDTSIVTQFTGAAMIVWIIQELKLAGWFPHVTVDTTKVNRFVSAIGALLTGAAIHWTWDSTAHVLTISGLTAGAIATFLWNAAQQFVGQEMIYQFIYAPKMIAQQTVAKQEEVVHTATKEVVHAIEDTKEKP